MFDVNNLSSPPTVSVSFACVSYTEKPILILSLNLALPPSFLAPASLEHEDMSRLLGMLITLNYPAHLVFLFISVSSSFCQVNTPSESQSERRERASFCLFTD